MTKLSIGTWLSLPNESIAEIFANAGYEWIVIDLEHSSIGINQAERLIRVIDLAGSKPFVRLSAHDPSQIKRVLDAGAKGILAPMIETVHQTESIISACKYPPDGIRGMGLARAQGYGENSAKNKYINQKVNEIEIYVQIESKKGLKNCKEIFSKDINGYFIGPYDLSASLNNPGKFDTDEFYNAEKIILSAAKEEGIKCGYHLVEPDKDKINELNDKGYNMIAFSVDIRMLDVTARLPFNLKMKNTLGVIPARMSSSRFPGKPLEKILDVPMLAHCYERALLSGVCDNLVVATPDQEIIDWAIQFEIPSVLTSHSHKRATERAKETLDILANDGLHYDLVLLLQGDEPQIFPEDIGNLKQVFSNKELEVVNLVFPISGDDLEDPNVVKVALDKNLTIHFFSRSHIPHDCTNGYRQLGMIGLTNKALNDYVSLLPTALEEVESIDMMRLIENDFSIQGVLSTSPILGVDTPQDLKKVEKIMMNDKFVNLYKEKYI